MAISFVGAGAVATGASPAVAVPAGTAQGDLLLLVFSGTTIPAFFTSISQAWVQLVTQGTGQFLTVFYTYSQGATQPATVTLSVAGASTKAVVLAYRDAGAFETLPAFTVGTGTTVTPNTLTTTYANDYVVSIYADALNATPATWTPNGSTTSRVNSANTSTVTGLLIADELQAAAGVSTARAATLSSSASWSSLAIALVETRTVYWVGGTGTWNSSATTNWSNSSGGSGGALPPGLGDTAVIDNSSGTGTITCDSSICRNLTVTASQAITLGTTGSTLTVGGSLTYPAGGSFQNSTLLTTTFFSTFTNNTITTNGKSVGALIFNNRNGTWILQDTLTAASITLTYGNFNSNSQTINCVTFNSNAGSNPRSLTLGTSTINLSGTGSVANFGTGFGYTTVSATSATFSLTDASSTARSITYPNTGTYNFGTLNIGGATGSSTTTITNGISVTIALSSTKPVASTILLAGTSGINISNWTAQGSVGNLLTVRSSTNGTRRTVTYTGAAISVDYMSFRDVEFTLAAGGLYRFYAGVNSINSGNNRGIAFIDGTTQRAYILTSGTSWTVPADWNSSNNSIYMIGAGGGGATSAASGSNRAAGGGGGGGGYTVVNNFSATPLSSITYAIGTGVVNANGLNTTWNSGAYIAGGGQRGTATVTPNSSGGAGGTGTIAGGVGGVGSFGTAASTGYGSGGGGGAGGPNGVGGTGGNGFASSTNAFTSGGGGGGNGGGSAGDNGISGFGGAGGNNFLGVGGGASSSGVSNPGTFGGGGGATSSSTFTGANGGLGIDILNTIGGGGGQGGNGARAAPTTNGGIYGGGGAGSGVATSGGVFVGSPGADGVIFIVYDTAGGGNVTVTLTGVSATTQLGTVTVIPTDITVSLSGLQAITLLGTATTISSVAVDLAGVQGNTVLGTPTVIGNANTNITGVVGTTDLGSVTVTFPTNITVDLTGVVGTTQLGTASLITNNFINVTGLVGATQLGTVAALISIDVSVTGVFGTTILGDVEAIESVFITLIGVQAMFILNLVNVWGDIIPVPTSPWDPVDASQTETWVIIDKAAG
jgi:hypothetical protein